MNSISPDSIAQLIRQFLAGMAGLAQTYYTLVLAVSALIGVYLIGIGFLRFANSARGGLGLGATEIFIGVVFVNLTTWFNDLSLSLMNVQAADSPLNYAIAGDTNAFHVMRITAVAIIEAVGAWGVVRGLWLFRESHYDRQAFWSAMIHTVCGCLALNFTTFAVMVDSAFGGLVSTSFNILGITS